MQIHHFSDKSTKTLRRMKVAVAPRLTKTPIARAQGTLAQSRWSRSISLVRAESGFRGRVLLLLQGGPEDSAWNRPGQIWAAKVRG